MSWRSLNRYQDKHRLSRLGEARLHGRMDAVLGNSRAVLAGLDRDAARQALGLAGQRRAERDFSLDACTARYARLYDGLLRGDRRPVREILDDAPARKARAS